MNPTWRLILSEHEAGAWNMALDEAILLSTARKESPPTLRLYGWQPATLSLGFAQPSSDVDVKRLARENWGLVRRPTGGRAILHVDELTYAVIAPQDDPLLAGSLMESYHTISRALLAGLVNLNIAAAGEQMYSSNSPGRSTNPVCFETPSNYEITVNKKKLIGSAQARKHGGILQHGSLPIKGDITRITHVLNYENEQERMRAAAKLAAHASTLEVQLGFPPMWQTVAQAIINGFSTAFSIKLEPGQPTAEEMEMARELMNTKYTSPDWTFRI